MHFINTLSLYNSDIFVTDVNYVFSVTCKLLFVKQILQYFIL